MHKFLIFEALEQKNKMMNKEVVPSPILSVIPLLALVILLACVISVFGSDALSGASQISLLFSTALCISISILFYRVPWKKFEESISENIKGTSVALLILLIIGALSGSWMVSGIVPTLIYYGIQIIHPDYFLVTSCVICAVVSLMTGSSWTTIATIGVALLGIGKALGFSDGWIAGAIISGAYFGDKISPLSDTTVLASSSAGTQLFTHIRYMMFTTIPSMLIALLIFLFAGFAQSGGATQDIASYLHGLDSTFCISGWLMIVPVLTGILIYKQVPSLITLFASVVMAAIMAILFQPDLLVGIADTGTADAWAIFKGIFITMYGATAIDTGLDELNELVSTGGMAGMMDTIWLILCAMCFGGAMSASGMLKSFLKAVFSRLMHTRFGLVLSTVLNGLFLNLATGDQYISIILTATMFRDKYAEEGYEPRLLSRSCEDSATVVSVLIPWNTCGMTQASVLGVATIVYFPYCFFNLISPVMSCLQALIGWKIKCHKGNSGAK